MTVLARQGAELLFHLLPQRAYARDPGLAVLLADAL
jgi:hypothetical protein